MARNFRKKTAALRKITFLWLSLLVGILTLLYLFLAGNPTNQLYSYLNNRANWFIFAALMTVLPIIGAPISIFLVMVGMMFGLTGGIILTGLLMLLHLFVTYYLTHSFLRPMVIGLLDRFSLDIPKLPQKGGYRLSFIFMVIPGLPYSVKNYLLALSDLTLKPYVLISWLTQFGTSIPFIILGKGVAELNPTILALAVLILLFSLLIQYYLRQCYKITNS